MYDLEKYYQTAFTGDECEDDSIIPYIKSFKHVILWGASFLGKAIGKKLISYGVEIENYWDLRYEEIKECNGINVIEPYTSGDAENCLIIVCIGNRVIFSHLISTLKKNQYHNHIFGDYLYMGLICPFDKTTGINAKRCSCTMECRQIYCHRIKGILSGNIDVAEEPIFLPSVTLIVNQRCSLKCKYCTSYMNEYAIEDRVDFPIDIVYNDIDKFFDTIDLIGTVTVMGGEPFMHPQISEIIKYLCRKKNFGLISIATSGTYPIKPEQLVDLYDERVNVSFSNYTDSISEKQKEVFYKNINLLKEKGICHTVGLYSPEWIVPPTLV